MSNNNSNNLFSNNMKNLSKTVNSNISKTTSKVTGKKGSGKVMMLLILVLVLYLFYKLYRSVLNNSKSHTAIVPTIRQGTSSKTPMSGKRFASPNDGQYGTEFTYCGWLYINGTNFSEKQSGSCSGSDGKKRWVFVKGSDDYLSNGGEINYPLLQAPGVWIYPYENKLEINMNTFASTVETCNIGNLPVGKWFHIVIMLTICKICVMRPDAIRVTGLPVAEDLCLKTNEESL